MVTAWNDAAQKDDTNRTSALPLATRNALDLLVLLPGANTTGGSRGTTFNGLPNNAINITIDGINTQDNYYRGYCGDGFFSMISTHSLSFIGTWPNVSLFL